MPLGSDPQIGTFATLGLIVVTGTLGAYLARCQGLGVLQRMREEMAPLADLDQQNELDQGDDDEEEEKAAHRRISPRRGEGCAVARSLLGWGLATPEVSGAGNSPGGPPVMKSRSTTAMVWSAVLCLASTVVAAPAVTEEAEVDATIRAQIETGEWLDADLVDPWGWLYEMDCPLRVSLEAPPALPNERWGSMRPRRFRCDFAVSVAPVGISPRYRKGTLERVHVVLNVKVDPPQDKLVDLRSELLLDGETAAQAGRAGIQVEEGKPKRIELPLRFEPGALERWTNGVEHARSRVYVSAVDD